MRLNVALEEEEAIADEVVGEREEDLQDAKTERSLTGYILASE